nr:hypothetical protein [Tanacetum cinerariifolium]
MIVVCFVSYISVLFCLVDTAYWCDLIRRIKFISTSTIVEIDLTWSLGQRLAAPVKDIGKALSITWSVVILELKLENERLLEHIICQDVVNIVMHADDKSVNMLHVQNTFLDDNIALDMMKMENDRLMELLVSQDLVHTAINSLVVINDDQSKERSYGKEYERNLKLVAELSQMNELLKTYSRLEQRCISLELKLQHNKESFQNDKPCESRNAPEIHEFL